MPDLFTEKSTIGWGSQIKESFKSVLVGIILFVAAFPALFLNEGCYVKDMKALAEGESNVVSVAPDKVDPANDAKLVHMIGEAKTDAVLADPDFGVSWNAIRLVRTAEMYQWEEEKETKETKKTGGKVERETTYKYNKAWSESLIDSSSFEHQTDHVNPSAMRFQTQEWAATDVLLGAFKLSESLIASINKFTDLAMGEPEIAKIPQELFRETTLADGKFYVGDDPASPQIGDIRISYKIVSQPVTVSLYSKQSGNSFVKYVAANGRALERLEIGSKSAQEMFAAAKQESKIKTWIIRFGGLIAMALGLTMIFKPLVAVANVLPFMGDLIGGGVFLFAGVVAFGLSFITISIAWVFYRPLVGIPLLLIGLGSVVAFIVVKKKGKAA